MPVPPRHLLPGFAAGMVLFIVIGCSNTTPTTTGSAEPSRPTASPSVAASCAPANSARPSVGVGTALPGCSGPDLVWVRQSGTAGADASNGVSVDDRGSVYVAGETAGVMDGANMGETDAYIAKYRADGTRVWVRQIGTTERDDAGAICVDRDGNAYISGLTFGGLDGPNRGAYDAFVAKFDPDGNRLWVAQFGTADRDYASSVTTDRDGNVYIAGDTFGALGGANAGVADAYVLKMDSSGRQVWVRQLGSEEGDVAKGVATEFTRPRVYRGTNGWQSGTNER